MRHETNNGACCAAFNNRRMGGRSAGKLIALSACVLALVAGCARFSGPSANIPPSSAARRRCHPTGGRRPSLSSRGGCIRPAPTTDTAAASMVTGGRASHPASCGCQEGTSSHLGQPLSRTNFSVKNSEGGYLKSTWNMAGGRRAEPLSCLVNAHRRDDVSMARLPRKAGQPRGLEEGRFDLRCELPRKTTAFQASPDCRSRSILAAMMKSLSVRPLTAWVHSVISTLPQARSISGW